MVFNQDMVLVLMIVSLMKATSRGCRNGKETGVYNLVWLKPDSSYHWRSRGNYWKIKPNVSLYYAGFSSTRYSIWFLMHVKVALRVVPWLTSSQSLAVISTEDGKLFSRVLLISTEFHLVCSVSSNLCETLLLGNLWTYTVVCPHQILPSWGHLH